MVALIYLQVQVAASSGGAGDRPSDPAVGAQPPTDPRLKMFPHAMPGPPRPRLPVLPRFERDRADYKVLFVDDALFADLTGDIGLRMHRPSPAGQVVLGHNYNQTVTYCLVHPDISTTSYQGSYHIQ